MQSPLIYTISGSPIAIVKNSHIKRTVLDPLNLRKFNCKQELTNQHDDQPLLDGSWQLDVQFFFKSKTKRIQRHIEQPTLIQLMRFIEEIGRGVIFKHECILTSMTVAKNYTTEDPHTTLIFKRST